MIILIGTIHARPIGEDIKTLIKSLEGWHVAIELDELRLKALMEEKGSKKPPGFIMGALYYVEKIIAEKGFGGKIGVDMLSAYKFAKDNGFLVSLIDKPIEKIIGELTEISLFEKVKLFGEVLLYYIYSLIGRSGDLEVRKLVSDEETILTLLKNFQKRYPRMYDILVKSRDDYLMRRILELEEKYGNVVAFLGLAHVINIKEKIKESGRKLEKINEIKTTIAYRIY